MFLVLHYSFVGFLGPKLGFAHSVHRDGPVRAGGPLRAHLLPSRAVDPQVEVRLGGGRGKVRVPGVDAAKDEQDLLAQRCW